MFSNYGIRAEDSRCANRSHFIPLLILSKGHHYLPINGSSQTVVMLSIQNGQPAHVFPCTRRKEVFIAGNPVHVYREIFKRCGIVRCKSEQNFTLPPPEATTVTCGRCEYTRVVRPDNILQLVLISLFSSNIFW